MLEVRPCRPLTIEWLHCLNQCHQIPRYNTLLHPFDLAANHPLLIRLQETLQSATVSHCIHARAQTQTSRCEEMLEVRLLCHLLTGKWPPSLKRHYHYHGRQILLATLVHPFNPDPNQALLMRLLPTWRLRTFPDPSVRHKIPVRALTQIALLCTEDLEVNLWRRLAHKQPRRRPVIQTTNFLPELLCMSTLMTLCQTTMV
ncbi:hypothetical protein F4604DRAFT_1753328 [Suillus subluteus]|nr:hypothetical protein F4604DRAFT_1753328 [Suillus subluteus]